jgi:hypothetical protein
VEQCYNFSQNIFKQYNKGKLVQSILYVSMELSQWNALVLLLKANKIIKNYLITNYIIYW